MSHEDPRRPSQTTPALPVAAGLTDDFTYGGIWTGQSNSLPWGLPADAFDPDFALELSPMPTGLDLVSISMPANAARAIGEVELLLVDASVVVGHWNSDTFLRFGTQVAPEKGYAEVLISYSGAIQVRWIVVPTDGAATVSGYLVRENGKWASYENTRVLTPFLPWRDIQPQVSNAEVALPGWATPIHSDYPVEDGAIAADGLRLSLPAPYTLPAAVTVFDDLALFLPMTRREGSDGYGISEIADSTHSNVKVLAPALVAPRRYTISKVGTTDFTLVGAASNTVGLEFEASGATTGDGEAYASPEGHPITGLAGEVFTFQNAIPVGSDLLAGAYVLIDWAVSLVGGASRRSWAKVASSSTATFTTDPASWLGDGKPTPTPVADTVTFDNTTDEITWAASTPPTAFNLHFAEGDRIAFSSVTALPAEVIAGRTYYVRNVAGNVFQISESMDHAVLNFTDNGTGAHTATQVWVYTVWLPHWKDNPHTWLPGPEFAYPNEDHQPRNVYCHFRARGRNGWAYNNQDDGPGIVGEEPFDGDFDSRFGALLPFAWRAGVSLGKVLHMVMLGIGSTPLATAFVPNTARGVYTGRVGWWNYNQHAFAIELEDSTSYLAKRLKRLVDFMAPQALVAEGITEPLRYLTHCHIQGEADGFTRGGREIYQSTIAGYRDWMRDIVVDAGFSPFTSKAKMPFAQPLITHIPYEVGSLSWSDTEGETNDAIREIHTDEEFSGYTLTDDLPKINEGHFSGGGMVILGARLAVVALDALEYALGFGSPALRTATHERLLDIANTALTTLGQGGQVVTDLTANTTEARLLSRYLPKATEQLMGMRTWSWATRIESASIHKHHSNPRYQFGYVVPGRAARVTKVIPFQESDSEGVYVSVIAPIMQDEIVDRGPYRFEIQRSPGGSRILFTDVPQVDGVVETQIAPIPGNAMAPDRLPKRPLIVYVDKQVNPDRYSPSFAQALTYMLAGFIAPALVRGEAGMKVQKDMFAASARWVAQEGEQEGANQHQPLVHQPDWFKARWE